MPCQGRIDSLPVVIDISCYAAGTFDETFTYKAGDTEDALAAVDLTGWAGEFRITFADGTAAVYDTGSAGGVTLGGATGRVRVYIPAGDTADYPDGPGQYELILTADEDSEVGDAAVVPLAVGRFDVWRVSAGG